jgi:hypothetical protein
MLCLIDNRERLWRVFVLLLATAGAVLAQAGGRPTAAQGSPPTPPLPAQVGSASVPALYRFFFRHLGVLDSQAATMDAEGKNGNELRNYYQTILNWTPAEAAIVKQNATSCVTAIQQLDQQAQAIIQQIKAAYPLGINPSSGAPPAPDARLVQLTQQRDSVTNAQVTSLQSSLSAATFQKLDTWIKTQFARQVSSVPIVYHPPAGGSQSLAAGGNK